MISFKDRWFSHRGDRNDRDEHNNVLKSVVKDNVRVESGVANNSSSEAKIKVIRIQRKKLLLKTDDIMRCRKQYKCGVGQAVKRKERDEDIDEIDNMHPSKKPRIQMVDIMGDIMTEKEFDDKVFNFVLACRYESDCTNPTFFDKLKL